MSSATSELITSTMIKAGAGAGKTTTLVETFVNFCLSYEAKNKKWPKVVITTFTRKATQELKERLQFKALQINNQNLFDFISGSSRLHISTIHGLLSALLRQQAAGLGLSQDFELITESDETKNIVKILRQNFMASEQLSYFLEHYGLKLTVHFLKKYFQLWLCTENFRPATENDYQKILLNKINVFKNNTKNLFVQIQNDLGFYNDPSYKNHQEWQDYVAHWLQLQDWTVLGLLKNRDGLKKPRYVKDKALFSSHLNEQLENWREELDLFCDDQAFDPQFWPDFIANNGIFQNLANEFSEKFYQYKIKNSQLTMQDLESFSLRLLRQSPDSVQQFSNQWNYWMIDEYQDNNPIQVELLEKMISDSPYFIVGDPQQSIYLFRGSRSEVFQKKAEQIQSKETNSTYIEKMINYRSQPHLLHFFNSFFCSEQRPFAAMSASREDTPQDQISVFFYLPEVTLNNNPELLESKKRSSELKAITFRIQELLQKNIPAEKISILVRTNSMAEDIGQECKDNLIPFQIYSGGGFLEKREVKDALFLLRFLLNPHDNTNLIGLLRGPWHKVSDALIIKSISKNQNSHWKSLSISLPDHSTIASLKKLLVDVTSYGLPYTFRKALIEFKYFEQSYAIDPSGRSEANLWKLVTNLEEKTRQGPFVLHDFLNQIHLQSTNPDSHSLNEEASAVLEPNKVHIMTVHASKGLQFDHVILPFLGKSPSSYRSPQFIFDEDENIWSLLSKDEDSGKIKKDLLSLQVAETMQQREKAEIDRVLYVAMTRARETITLIWDPQAIAKKSWAQQIINLPEMNWTEGQYNYKNLFSYKVKNNAFDIQAEQVKTEKNIIVNDPWQKIAPLQNVKSTSFTEVHSKSLAQNKNQLIDFLNKADQGIFLHHVFQTLQLQKNPDTMENYYKLSDSEHKSLHYLRQLDQIPFSDILKNGFSEWGFSYLEDQIVYQGQIDLWAKFDNQVWIVDYKTGDSKYKDKAFEQLKTYARALQKTQQIETNDKTHLVALYPLEEKYFLTTLF
ncbi:MAG: UvrD-helicase domain-containing protein [Pseudobdellovibrionaceae bacterium]